MSLLARDQAAVDAAARAVPSVIDALVAGVPAARREQLARTLPGADGAWLAREGEHGAFLLAAQVRADFVALPRHGAYGWIPLVDRANLVLEYLGSRPVAPWIWIELIGVLPSHHRTIAENLDLTARLFGRRYLAAARHAIARKIPARGMLFERLRRERALSVEELLAGLGDPPLRPTCEQLLADHVEEVADALRARLTGASKGETEAIVRLLRTLDPRVDASGHARDTSLAELESRLRASPLDRETAHVWADHLQEQHDPRGALLALDLAIAAAEPAKQLELSAARGELFARERKAIVGKPGGWPFREKYVGRGLLRFGTTWRAMLRGKPATVEDKVNAFVEHCTDREAPSAKGSRRLATFRLTWPGSEILLPYQEPAHYGEPPGPSQLEVDLASGKLSLQLWLPFERFDDPGFVAVYQGICETLGAITLTPTGFSVVTPTVDGKKLKSKLQRYAGPATPHGRKR